MSASGRLSSRLSSIVVRMPCMRAPPFGPFWRAKMHPHISAAAKREYKPM